VLVYVVCTKSAFAKLVPKGIPHETRLFEDFRDVRTGEHMQNAMSDVRLLANRNSMQMKFKEPKTSTWLFNNKRRMVGDEGFEPPTVSV
jgi:hypothetical protein